MMNFLVIADTHRRRDNIAEAFARNQNIDAILHLGDGADDFDDRYRYRGIPLYCVRGNCDVFGEDRLLPEELILHLDEYTVMMLHGHLFGTTPAYFEKAALHAAQNGADILLFGHTHFPLEKYLPEGTAIEGITLEKPLYIFNPGSLGRIREGLDGKYHFGTMRTTPSGVVFGHGTI